MASYDKTYQTRWGGAQSVKHPTLDFGSDQDLMDHGIEPHIRLQADSTEPAWDSLSPSLSLPLPCSLSLSKINTSTRTRTHTHTHTHTHETSPFFFQMQESKVALGDGRCISSIN